MSDTDDTDDLLLIPPDFFSVHSDTEDSTKPYGPYYKIVDNLITQVNKLENRISSIETTSDSSFVNNSIDNYLDSFHNINLMSGARRYSSLEDVPQEVYIGSTQSTPQKPRTKLKLNSLPTTPGSRQSPSKTQVHHVQSESPHIQYPANNTDKKMQNEILNEIDTFISNVKTIQKFQAAKNLNVQFDKLHEAEKSIAPKVESQLPKIDKLTNRASYFPYTEEPVKEPYIYSRNIWKEGETKFSVPDHGMGMRDILYSNQPQNSKKTSQNGTEKPYQTFTATVFPVSQELSTSDVSARQTESVYSENSRSLSSSSDSTKLTAYQTGNFQGANIDDADKIQCNAYQVLNKHQQLLTRSTVTNSSIQSKRSNYKPSSRNKLALMSLSELWNQPLENLDHSKFLNKLQEEKLRRQHCEQLIQQMQTRTLELQERLAVAIQVDEAKDEAILQIHKSWEENSAKIDSLNREKMHLEEVANELKAKLSVEASEAVKKTSHYENEASKALNLAHNTQEKLASLEKQNEYLTTELESLEKQFKSLQDNYKMEVENSQELTKILSQKEVELNENRNILSSARKEVAQSKRAVEICQSELTSMRMKQNELEEQLNEELRHINEVEIDKKQMLTELETHKKLEKTLQDDLNKQKEIAEQNKLELRNFYQEQVEIVVRDKLREFQFQLEKAENSLQAELHNREVSVAKAAAIHIQQITEKHALEIHLLEEKHKEEVKLYILQLSKAHQQIDNLHSKFKQQQERKIHIAQQLHKVMEAQWLETIKIINSKSPIISEDKSTNTIDQLNSLKSKSYNNVEEILFKDEPKGKMSGNYRISKPNMPSPEATSTVEDDFHSKSAPSIETPVSSRPQKSRQQLDQEIQKYIQMLLNKSPGNPLDNQDIKYDKTDQHVEHPSAFQQYAGAGDKMNEAFKQKAINRDRMEKPPWK